MQSSFPGAVPEIPVSSIASAIGYYEQSLGFTTDWGDEELGLAGISRGNCRLFLANEQYRSGYGNVGPALIWLNVSSADEVDELYLAWKTSNASIVSAPESKPWGLREFTTRDLDGNLFRVFYDFATAERG